MHSGAPHFAAPRVTKVVRRLLIAHAIVFAMCFAYWATGARVMGAVYGDFERLLGLEPSQWVESAPLVPAWQIFTYGFLHQINSAWHILFNLLTLYFFGTMLEERLGGRRFFLLYLCAQFVGGAFFFLPVLFGVHGQHVIGASGAVYGVMIATAVLYPRQRVYFFLFPIMLKWLAIGLVGLGIFAALVSLREGSDGVAHLVHLGGAAYGFLAVKLGLVDKDPIEILERKRAVREVQREADDEARMDRLLQKIHQEGMSSLTRSEKDFLKRMSSRR